MSTRTLLRAVAIAAAALAVGAVAAPAAAEPFPDPAADTRPGGLLAVYSTRFDGSVVRQERTAGGWTGQQNLGGRLIAGPSAVTLPSGDTFLFGTGTDLAVWFRMLDAATGTWGPWASAGGRSYMAPEVSCADGSVVVYVTGTDGRAWKRELASPTWTSLGGRLITGPGAAVAVVGACPSVQELVGVGTNGVLYDNRGGGWVPMGGRTALAPAIIRSGPSADAYVTGSDGALWTASRPFDDDAWSPWRRIGGLLTSGPAAQRSDGEKIVVARGGDGYLWRAASPVDGGPWSWSRIPGSL